MLKNVSMLKSWIIAAFFVIGCGILFGMAVTGLHVLVNSPAANAKSHGEEEFVIPMGTHLVYQDENTRIYEIPPKEDGGNTYIITKVYDKKNDMWVPFSVSAK